MCMYFIGGSRKNIRVVPLGILCTARVDEKTVTEWFHTTGANQYDAGICNLLKWLPLI